MIEPLKVRFLDTQFRHQVEAGDFALNPFEQKVLAYPVGNVLELGCGLGNRALTLLDAPCNSVAPCGARKEFLTMVAERTGNAS